MVNQKKEEQRQLWISRICEIEECGMSQGNWCSANKAPCSTLRYWVSKLKKEAAANNQQTNWLKVDAHPGKDIATVSTMEDSMNDQNIRITVSNNGAFPSTQLIVIDICRKLL